MKYCTNCNCDQCKENKRAEENFEINIVLNVLNQKNDGKFILKNILTSNKSVKKAIVESWLSSEETEELINQLNNYCPRCKRIDADYNILGIGPIPKLYDKNLLFGGIGPTTLVYNKVNNTIVAYDPAIDILVTLILENKRR